MKLLIQNTIKDKLLFTCKTCGREYKVDYDDLSTLPLWNFESCSKVCAQSDCTNKLVSLQKS